MGHYADDIYDGLDDWSGFKVWSTVVNRKTGLVLKYALGPRKAVLHAYAQYQVRDQSLRDYWEKYGHLLVETETEWQMGDFYVLRSRKATKEAELKRKRKPKPVPPGQGSLF